MLSSKTSDSSRISNSGRIAFEQTFIVLEFCRRRFLRMFVRALTMAMVVVVGGVVVVVVPVVSPTKLLMMIVLLLTFLEALNLSFLLALSSAPIFVLYWLSFCSLP